MKLIFLAQWEQALNEDREVIVVGDVNLDFLLVGKDVNSNSHAHRLRELSQLFFDRIFPLGVVQCVRGLPCWRIYSCDEPETAVNILSDFVKNILDKHAPVKTFQVRKKYCPRVSETTKLS